MGDDRYSLTEGQRGVFFWLQFLVVFFSRSPLVFVLFVTAVPRMDLSVRLVVLFARDQRRVNVSLHQCKFTRSGYHHCTCPFFSVRIVRSS